MELRVERLSKAFGPVAALSGVSFTVAAGEVVGLIGPNGAGKSTLLACVAGLDAPDEGTVRIGDAEAPVAARRRALFYLPDAIAPWREQRASWILDFAVDAFGADPAWRTATAPALAIDAFAGRRLGDLSKGQRKRILLALALAVPRTVTLIDEPFDGLDPRQARAFGVLVRERAASGRAFVLSIHAMDDAARTCDRQVLLHEGRVVADGTLDALRGRFGLGADAGLAEVFLAAT